MSQKAKRFIAERVSEEGTIEFSQLQQELMDEFEVASTTAAPYIYKYATYEERNGDRIVLGMDDEHQDALAAIEGLDEEGEFESADPIPPATGKVSNGLQTRQPGHPEVPQVGSYIKRPMGGADVDVDFDENATFLDVLGEAMSVKDFGVLLIGEPGTGKSLGVKKACADANIPHSRVNFGSRVTKEKLVGGFVPRGNGETLEQDLERARELAEGNDDLSVGRALEVIGERDKFEWVDGILTKRVRNGGVFQADELNAAPPEALMALHGLLEDQANRSLELLEKGEVVEPHEEFMFVGTMNPPSFKGTQELNDALKGRLIPIEVPQLEPKAEKGLLADSTDLTRKQADDLVEMALDIRTTDNVPPCTLRELKKIAEMKDAVGLEGATKMVLTSIASTQTEKDAVLKRIQFNN